MMRKKMSENAFRKQLIREGYWNWLTENPKPINVNWGIIEANLGYRLSAKSKNAFNKSLYKSLYKTILESDSEYEFGDVTAQAMAEERKNPTITVNWRQAELALGGKIPEKVKARFIKVMNGTSFKLSRMLKYLAGACAMAGMGGTFIRHLSKDAYGFYMGSGAQTAAVVAGIISLVLFGISKLLSNKSATLPDIKPNNNLSKAEINDINMELKDMWNTSQTFVNEKPTLIGIITSILTILGILFSTCFFAERGIRLY